MEQVRREHIRDFDLDHIFDCGQAFRWERQADGSYTGVAGGRIANVRFLPDACDGDCQKKKRQEEGQLVLSNVTENDFQEFWSQYLDLERDYGAIKKALAKDDAVMDEAIGWGQGIRLLRQDPWETLLSFIISQNNHIPRIKACVKSLCENFGQKIGGFQGRDYYSMPEPEALAVLKPDDLAVCGLGYRAKYLIGTARQVAEDGIEHLRSMALPEVSGQQAFDYVTRFHGVGPKVANCVLLFSMGKYDRFPVDVWVKRVMKELYGLETPKEIERFARETFGRQGGFAQQYLFYYIREKARRQR